MAQKKTTEKKSTTSKATGATVTVRQTHSPIGRPDSQRQTLIGLGLKKRHQERTLQDTPEVRGMINKIPHLVEIVEPK